MTEVKTEVTCKQLKNSKGRKAVREKGRQWTGGIKQDSQRKVRARAKRQMKKKNRTEQHKLEMTKTKATFLKLKLN